MKVTKTPNFSPINITIETQEELTTLLIILSQAEYGYLRDSYGRENYCPSLVKELQARLKSESNKTF